ncbi:hypothetical protein V8G54_002459 [Vigna mungo]|uniref:Uncharacterized protein n=1 Tax=Vigna mungo TaxID=3915 RepID=A0AAQ3PAR9_VIGMU
MVHITWRPSRTILSFRIIKNPILPVATLCFPISESVHSQSLSSSFMPCPLIPMTILKLIHSKTMHLVGKIFTSVFVPISEMVLSVSMFDTPFEPPNIAAPIIASVDSKPMTLPIRPLTTIHITTVEPIDPHSMPQTFPILPSIPAPPCPCLHTIPIILPINPIPFITPTHVIVINPTSPTLSLLEFTLVHIPIAVNLHPTSPTCALHLLRVRPNGPNHRVSRRGGRRRRR